MKASQAQPDFGSLAEQAAKSVVEAAFTSDFVFHRPKHLNGKELADLLVLFNDVAIVVQVKAEARVDSATPRARTRYDWAVKNLRKACAQTKGALRSLESDWVAPFTHPFMGDVTFSKQKYPNRYGLVVLDHICEPYEPYEHVSDIVDVPSRIQVLSLRDLWNLCRILDTPWDLVTYLECRADKLLSPPPLVHQERPLFESYLASLEGIMGARCLEAGRKYGESDFKTYADGLRAIASGTCRDIRAGLVIDHIITKLHDIDWQTSTANAVPTSDERQHGVMYPKMAELLGSLARVRRIQWGRRFLNAAKNASLSATGISYVTVRSANLNLCAVLACSNHSRYQRAERRQMLINLSRQARQKYRLGRTLGVATEPAGSMGSSYDFVYMEG